MKNPILVSEHFSRGNIHYFLDYCQSANKTLYFMLTRVVYQSDGSCVRTSLPVFEEDFSDLVLGLSSLVHSAAYLDSQDKTVQNIFNEQKKEGNRGIKSWEPERRPREKMCNLGACPMSNAELLTIIIGSGTPDETAVALSERMLNTVDDKLHRLSALSYADFCCFKGMGIAKSSSIIAAFELARRIYSPISLIKFN